MEEKHMAENTLQGCHVAILATDGVEQVELTAPRDALVRAGAETTLISPKDKVKAWQHDKWGDELDVDRGLTEVNPDQFDALLLPGGVMSPDKLRTEPRAVEFVEAFIQSGKPIAAICHGPWMLLEAGGVR